MASRIHVLTGFIFTVLFSLNKSASSQGCEDVLEIVAVVDGSDSISADDFQMLRNALVDLTGQLNIAEAYTRFGVIIYSSDIAAQIPFSGNRTQLESDILSLPHPRDGTNTHMGISTMMNMITNSGRPGVKAIGIVITDGISKNPTATINQANLAKNMNVDMFSVGVGLNDTTNEILNIASSPSQAIQTNAFTDLAATLKVLLPDVCPPPTTTTTTTTTTTEPPTTTSTPTTTTTTPTTTTTAPTTTTPTTTTPTTTSTTPTTTTPTTTATEPTTTTTPSTTQTPASTTLSSAVLCEGCVMPNGIGYNPHPTDCHKYIQCDFSTENKLRALTMNCPSGLFWDQDGLTCNFPHLVNCSNDPCLNPLVTFYKPSTNCRHYRSCSNTTTPIKCCVAGTSFNIATSRCESDVSCTDQCQGEQTDAKHVCLKRAVASETGVYEENVPGFGWMKRPCAPGTTYNHTHCGCSIMTVAAPTPVQECKAMLNLTFDNGVMDTSGQYNWVSNQGVVINNGIAYFNGVSGLRIPRFSNVALGSTFMIKMKYRAEGSVQSQQALVTNRDCGKPGSVAILLNEASTSFGMRTESGLSTTVVIAANPQNDWKEVVYRVAGGVLSGSIGGITISDQTNGAIGKSECALQIGRGNTYNNFRGYVDYVEVYMC